MKSFIEHCAQARVREVTPSKCRRVGAGAHRPFHGHPVHCTPHLERGDPTRASSRWSEHRHDRRSDYEPGDRSGRDLARASNCPSCASLCTSIDTMFAACDSHAVASAMRARSRSIPTTPISQRSQTGLQSGAPDQIVDVLPSSVRGSAFLRLRAGISEREAPHPFRRFRGHSRTSPR